jgi:hypothetical protein
VLLRALVGAAGWPDGSGEGSTESVSPDPSDQCYCAGRSLGRPRKVLPDSAMGLRPTCAPLTSGIPRGMQSAGISATLCKVYTRHGSKLSSSNSTFFHFAVNFSKPALLPFSYQAMSDERISDLPQHLINP